MSNRPWYKRFPSDFIAGTISLTLEEAGAYSYIIDLIHDRGGPIPDDPQWIARVCGCSTRKWNTIRKRLIRAGKISEKEGLILSFRAEKDAINGGIERDKLAESGVKGGRKSPEKKTTLSNNNGLAENRLKQSICQKPEEERTLSGSKEKPPKRKSKIPDGWEPSDRGTTYALEKGMSLLTLETEAERFRDYHLKNGKLFIDWEACWRTWVQNWVGYEAERKAKPTQSGDGFAQLAAERLEADR